jgi:hypothetical protein
LSAWERYVSLTEKRIATELEGEDKFLVGEFFSPEDAGEFRNSVLSGTIFVRKMDTRDEEGKKIDVPRGMVHHWYGSIFVPDVEMAEVLEWVRNYSNRHLYFEEVEESRLLSREELVFKIFLRLKRKKVITVHYNTEHEVSYQSHGPGRESSTSYSTKIAEIEEPGSPREREKPEGNDRGFLWRLNSYWRFKQVDGGVIVDCESMSLSRSAPIAVKWMVNSYINSVPRESLENALAPIRDELAGTSGSD